MMVKDFNKEYKKKGGMMMLNEMRALKQTQDTIANHFGVTKERVRQWLLEFFGKEYDPRYDRRNAIIESMVDFSEHRTAEEFHEAFKNSEYYEMALKNTTYDSE